MSGEPLRFLSWNLAMLERSAEAPLYWDASATEAQVRETVLDLEPDVVLYQELPGIVPFVETHSMLPAQACSHSGNIATLVANQHLDDQPQVKALDGCAVLATFAEPELTIANVHLVSGRGAASDRLAQVAEIIDASPTEALLIVGDTNMRVAEADSLIDLGLRGEKPPAATWDSQRNRFRPGAAEFSAYFTRWFASPNVGVSNVVVHQEPVEHNDHKFFLSDHYAISGSVTLTDASQQDLQTSL